MPKMKVNMGTPAAPNWVVMDAKDTLTLQGKSAADFTLVGHGHQAKDISIVDTGNKITATDVEGALAEIATNVSNVTATANAALPKSGGDVTGDFSVKGKTWLAKNTTYGSTPAINVPIGDADTGINWVSDGKFEFWSNNVPIAAVDNGSFTFKDASGSWDTLANLKSSVSNGKNNVASAITGKGVPASGSDDFTTLSNKISQIQVGVKTASGDNVSFTSWVADNPNATGDRAGQGTLSIRGLSFRPSRIYVRVTNGYGNGAASHYDNYFATGRPDQTMGDYFPCIWTYFGDGFDMKVGSVWSPGAMTPTQYNTWRLWWYAIQ